MDSRKSVFKTRNREKKVRIIALLTSLIFPGAGHFFRGRLLAGIAGLVLNAGFLVFFLLMKPILYDLELEWVFWTTWLTSFIAYYLVMAYDAYKGVSLELAPCRRDCPAGINVPDYIALVAAGRHQEADELVRETAPLAGTLSRVCPAPCEKVCTRTRIEAPIAIRAIKRAAQENKPKAPFLEKAVATNGKKVAVVGAGPSGLTCAHFLSRKGYMVDIFDTNPKPGGLLRTAIPAFRLPRNVIDEDISFIFNSNPNIKFYQRTLGENINLEQLEHDYNAIYLGIGLGKPRGLNVPGASLKGIQSGLSFLLGINDASACPTFTGHVAVLGGGDVAMDAARVAIRLGAKKVTVFYRRREIDMPANPTEIDEARAEGIDFEFLVTPANFSGTDDDKVKQMTLQRLRLLDAEKGRLSKLEPENDDVWTVDVEAVLYAIGQQPNTEFLRSLAIATDSNGRIKVNSRSMRTSRRKVFAGGDITATEAEPTVVHAIGEGRKAARGIDSALRSLRFGRLFDWMENFDPDFKLEKIEGAAWRSRKPDVHSRYAELCEHKKIDFESEAMRGIEKGDDIKEAKRCLRCQRYNIGFAFKKGYQKGYVSMDKR